MDNRTGYFQTATHTQKKEGNYRLYEFYEKIELPKT